MTNQPNPFVVHTPEQLRDYPVVSAARSDREPRDCSGSPGATFKLPDIDSAMELVADAAIVLPPQLVEGVLHQGLKGVIASGSKARKTWNLLDLALSVATGTRWWNWNTTQGRVLVVNFEIPKAFLKQRVLTLAKAKQLVDYHGLDIWTLRGCGGNFSKLIPAMIEQVRERKYALIIIDPIYKGLGGKDENGAGDIGEVCNLLECLAVETGAAVVYAHHFSKGNQAGKNPLDRMSGSGVFARDADTIIIMTRHEDEDCYTVDLSLRNLPDQPSFVVKWDYPMMRIDTSKNPENLQGREGRPRAIAVDAVLALLVAGPLTHAEWRQRATAELEVSASTFNRRLAELQQAGKVEKNGADQWQRKTDAPPPAPTPCGPPAVPQPCQNRARS